MSARLPASEPAIDPAIVRQAADWMARLWSENATDEDRAACARWRAARPDHEQAWNLLGQRFQAVESKLGDVQRDVARHALQEPGRGRLARRGMLGLLGIGAAGGVAYLARGTDTWRIAVADHSAGTGDIRELALPDGTRVVLASASAIDVRFTGSERLVVLRAGEVMVSTVPDPAPAYRPFRVQSREGTVQALGTRFTVRQEAGRSRVAVFEGAVEVRPAHAPDGAVRLSAGLGASFSADRAGAPELVQESAAAWTEGMLVANDMPLREVIAELARYRRGLLRCDPAVAGLTVTGAFSLRDTDRVLQNLALRLPVEVSYRTPYWVTVLPRRP